jgi:16S rRNA processing protein RimM
MPPDKYIPLGVVARAFGIKGEIRIRPHNPRTTWFDESEGVWLRKDPSREPGYYRIMKSRRHKDQIVLALEGIRDRNQAEELRGLEAVAPEDRLEPLEEGEYYWYRLIGLSMETVGGRRLGEVIRMEETSPDSDGNDVFVVRGEGGELLIPVTEEAVASIDFEKGRIVVNEMPGLTGG